MRYTDKINEFKQMILDGYKREDSKKPVKGSKNIRIVVEEREGGTAVVDLNYSEEFKRMFGKCNWATVRVFDGSLKEACQAARELKTEIKLPIIFIEYRESILY